MQNEISHLNSYISRRDYDYLDLELMSWTCYYPGLENLGRALYRSGVRLLGELVLTPVDELKSKYGMDDDKISEFNETLAPIGLRLGMKAPGWDKTNAPGPGR